jgi:hypothetical protein
MEKIGNLECMFFFIYEQIIANFSMETCNDCAQTDNVRVNNWWG